MMCVHVNFWRHLSCIRNVLNIISQERFSLICDDRIPWRSETHGLWHKRIQSFAQTACMLSRIDSPSCDNYSFMKVNLPFVRFCCSCGRFREASICAFSCIFAIIFCIFPRPLHFLPIWTNYAIPAILCSFWCRLQGRFQAISQLW